MTRRLRRRTAIRARFVTTHNLRVAGTALAGGGGNSPNLDFLGRRFPAAQPSTSQGESRKNHLLHRRRKAPSPNAGSDARGALKRGRQVKARAEAQTARKNFKLFLA